MSERLEPELERIARMLAEAGPLPNAPETLRERALAIPDGGPDPSEHIVPMARRVRRLPRPAALAGLAAAVAAIAIVPTVAVVSQGEQKQSIELAARPFAPKGGGSANVVAHGDGSATIELHVWKMPKPGAGRTYEAWLGREGDRRSLGTFGTDASGKATISWRVARGDLGYRWLWVTSEPTGGSTQPSKKAALWGPLA